MSTFAIKDPLVEFTSSDFNLHEWNVCCFSC